MGRQSRVRVLGQYFKIIYEDLTAENIDGDTDINKRLIRIDSCITDPEHIRRIIAHEKFHAKLAVSGISELLGEEVEEALAILAESRD